MRIIDLVDLKPVLEKYISTPMSARLAYALARNIARVNDQLLLVESFRNDLFVEHFDLKDSGEWVPKSQQDTEQFKKKFKEFLEKELDFSPVKVDLDAFDDLSPTPGDMLKLSWMIAE